MTGFCFSLLRDGIGTLLFSFMFSVVYFVYGVFYIVSLKAFNLDRISDLFLYTAPSISIAKIGNLL